MPISLVRRPSKYLAVEILMTTAGFLLAFKHIREYCSQLKYIGNEPLRGLLCPFLEFIPSSYYRAADDLMIHHQQGPRRGPCKGYSPCAASTRSPKLRKSLNYAQH